MAANAKRSAPFPFALEALSGVLISCPHQIARAKTQAAIKGRGNLRVETRVGKSRLKVGKCRPLPKRVFRARLYVAFIFQHAPWWRTKPVQIAVGSTVRHRSGIESSLAPRTYAIGPSKSASAQLSQAISPKSDTNDAAEESTWARRGILFGFEGRSHPPTLQSFHPSPAALIRP